MNTYKLFVLTIALFCQSQSISAMEKTRRSDEGSKARKLATKETRRKITNVLKKQKELHQPITTMEFQYPKEINPARRAALLNNYKIRL